MQSQACVFVCVLGGGSGCLRGVHQFQLGGNLIDSETIIKNEDSE